MCFLNKNNKNTNPEIKKKKPWDSDLKKKKKPNPWAWNWPHQPLFVVRSQNPGQAGLALYVHHLLRPKLHLQNQTQTQTQIPLSIDNPQPFDSPDSPDEGDHKHDSDAQATSIGAATTNSNRRPRGRPPRSKNKPKPPIIVTRDSLNALWLHVLEVSNIVDIVESVSNYVGWRGRGVCVLSGTGTVMNVTLKQLVGSSVVTLCGRFEILSLSDLKKTKPWSFGSQKKKKKKKPNLWA